MEQKTSVMRRLARVASVLAVAVLLGHVVQTISASNEVAKADPQAAQTEPKAIQPVAAGLDPSGQTRVAQVVPASPAAPADRLETPAPAPVPAPVQASITLPMPQVLVPTPATPEPAVTLARATPDAPLAKPAATPVTPGVINATGPAPSIVPKSMQDVLRPDAECTSEMDLAALPDAIIEITLLAPCHKSERLVVRHGPLAVTARTTQNGSVFLKLPALEADGQITLRFADGTEIKGAVPVPDMAKVKRFGVQWMDQDTFAVNAFEAGADYGAPGHVSAANPGKLPLTGAAEGGYLMILGDAEAVPAMLAEVYSYPRSAATNVELSIEAEVTPRTCDHELLGEVITTEGGTSSVTDLSLSMPECTAIGDILVLKNPLRNLTLAAAD